MKESKQIPVSKIKRAAKFATTGLKVGGNYLKHYGKKLIGQSDLETLHKDNADTIFDGLSQLKGSALKMIQMLSLDKNLLPDAYVQKFAEAQYKAPPLSGPLVVKTFKDYFGKTPAEIFDSFDLQAANAASFGQVHKAQKDGRQLAVKIQYPGVGESVRSDLKIAKPFATRLFKLTKDDIERYFSEVETKLIEETDYPLEIKRGNMIGQACQHIEGLRFPTYYPELSCPKAITMDWISGVQLTEFVLENKDQALNNRIGQLLWDFYDFQIHKLKLTHADPHPGNFIIVNNSDLAVLDFGCVKEIPQDFYAQYFVLIQPYVVNDQDRLEAQLKEMEIIFDTDSPEVKDFFLRTFKKTLSLLTRPFAEANFDFSDDSYFKAIFDTGTEIGLESRKMGISTGRGSAHSLYMSRTYFGLFNMLNQLKANIKTESKYLKIEHLAK